MKPRTIMAIGAHIGDMDLAAGPILAQNILDGGESLPVAPTAAEHGLPRLSDEEYKAQKVDHPHSFPDEIGASVVVFNEHYDGFLQQDETVTDQLAALIRERNPDLVLAHWPNSMHSD